MNSLQMTVRVFGEYDPPVRQVVPLVDGIPLADLVREAESEMDADVIGGYCGIIPTWFRYGSLLAYFLGQPDEGYWSKLGKVAILGCDCGEVGCWPLYTKISVGRAIVQWTEFEQPHRRGRDYSLFGPFAFDRRGYVAEIEGLAAVMAL